MSTSSFDSVFSLGATKIALSAETSLFMQPFQGQVSTVLKFISGGTLEIFGPGLSMSSLGMNVYTTLSAAGLSAASGTGYIFSSAEVVSVSGPAWFYLNARGATCVAMQLFGKGQGF